MKRYAITMIAVAAVGLGACGGGGTTTVITEPTTSTVEANTEPVDRNEEVANEYVKQSPQELSVICRQLDILGRAKIESMFTRILGPQVIRAGGEPSQVASLLIDRC